MMRRWLVLMAALGGLAVVATETWRRDPRIGSGFVNRRVNPVLVRQGIAGTGRSEVGTLEHVGRRSGTRRLTPVHPVVVGDEVRIVVPLGLQSHWAQNVLAAGGCRLQLHDEVLELDEPVLVPARMVEGLDPVARAFAAGFGILYLRLHLAGRRAGTLGPDDDAGGPDRAPQSAVTS